MDGFDRLIFYMLIPASTALIAVVAGVLVY